MQIKRPRPFGVVLLTICAFLTGCRDTPTAEMPSKSDYVLPGEITLEFSVERGDLGRIFVVGSTNLPDGTKLGAEVTEPGGGEAQDYKILVINGKFRSEGFTNEGLPIPAGKRKVHMLAYFNSAWQPPEVLRIVGDGGANLKGKPIKLQDRDVTDSDKIVDLTRVVDVPALDPKPAGASSAGQDAIHRVKDSILTVDGQRSATNLDANVALFMQSPGLRAAGGWTAKKLDGGKYLVSFDFIDGDNGDQQAIWELDSASNKVRYVNKRAKIMSWTPAD